MKQPPPNYLKYWKVVKYFVQVKYNLKSAEIDMLLFLYAEEKFSKDKFREFEMIMVWDFDRFKRLRKDGWIDSFRKFKGRTKALYELSDKGKAVCKLIYDKLSGDEMPETYQHNPLFKKRVPRCQRVYAEMIIKMNEETKRLRRLSLEQE